MHRSGRNGGPLSAGTVQPLTESTRRQTTYAAGRGVAWAVGGASLGTLVEVLKFYEITEIRRSVFGSWLTSRVFRMGRSSTRRRALATVAYAPVNGSVGNTLYGYTRKHTYLLMCGAPLCESLRMTVMYRDVTLSLAKRLSKTFLAALGATVSGVNPPK